jgi:hypothetical protein
MPVIIVSEDRFRVRLGLASDAAGVLVGTTFAVIPWEPTARFLGAAMAGAGAFHLAYSRLKSSKADRK